jgi:hypothetical protein
MLLAFAMPFAAVADPVSTPRAVVALPTSARLAGVLPSSARSVSPRTVTVDPATLCETAVTTAEYVNRLPPRLLGAISLTETGRSDPGTGRSRPWPWTLNAEGQGQFFETELQAIAAVRALQARGVKSIDVGCLQVNLMYHPDAFATLEQAFDPRINANYAARFLNTLYAGDRNWAHAIAAYHSETPILGNAYRVLVMARWQNGDTRAAPPSHAQYRDFQPQSDRVYGAFTSRSQVYGAFAPR